MVHLLLCEWEKYDWKRNDQARKIHEHWEFLLVMILVLIDFLHATLINKKKTEVKINLRGLITLLKVLLATG
jgi:hypothetical protein